MPEIHDYKDTRHKMLVKRVRHAGRYSRRGFDRGGGVSRKEAGKRDSLVRMTLWGYKTFSRSCWRDLEGSLPARVPGGEMPKADVEGDEERI